MADLEKAGIDYDDVIDVLIREGVEKFVKAWDEMVETVAANVEKAKRQLGQADA
jgi:transaldolase